MEERMEMYPFYNIDPRILKAGEETMAEAAEALARIEAVQDYNQQKMLAAFARAGISESMFGGSTGYGYDDRGREKLDEVYRYAFDAEDALVRHNFVCGTHALTVALFGVLRPGM